MRLLFKNKLLIFIIPLIIIPSIVSIFVTYFISYNKIKELKIDILNEHLVTIINEAKRNEEIVKKAHLSHIDYYIKDAQRNIIKYFGNINLKTGYFYVINSKSEIIYYPWSISEPSIKKLKESDHFRHIINTKKGTYTYYSDINKYKSLIVYDYFKGWDWYIVIECNEKELFKNILFARDFSIFISLIVIVFGVFILLIISKNVTESLKSIISISNKIIHGNYDKQIEVNSGDEFEEMADIFNKMTNKIKQTINNIKRKNDELVESYNINRSQTKNIEQIKNFLTHILNCIPSMIICVNFENKIVELNQTTESFILRKRESLLNKDFFELFPFLIDQKKDLGEVFIEKKEKFIRKVSVEFNDRPYIFSIAFLPVFQIEDSTVIIKIDNITENLKFEEMIVQNEKMLSLGGLASGMAHEINNPLGGILQSIQNIKRRLNPELSKNIDVADQCDVRLDKVKQYLKKRKILSFIDGIEKSGIRAAEIVKNMLAFSRKSNGEYNYFNIKDIIQTVINITSNDYDFQTKYDFKYIDIITDISDNVKEVLCIKNEIEQVLFNIVKNAAYALLENDIKNPKIILRSYMQDDFLIIEVENNGPHIPDDIKKNIFDPFFTTKDVGKGTGLGLSVSYFIIVDNHKGEFYVESEKNKNTVFTIKLPGKLNS